MTGFDDALHATSPLRHVTPDTGRVTTFDLVGKARGAWDVVVTNPDTTSQTLPGGFTIEVGRAPDPWVDVVLGVLYRHMSTPITIVYGNRGNVDAVAVLAQLSHAVQSFAGRETGPDFDHRLLDRSFSKSKKSVRGRQAARPTPDPRGNPAG